MSLDELYCSTDIETDGPIPGPHSMLSLATVVYRLDKSIVSEFSANLETLPGAGFHSKTKEFWDSQPREIWDACRKGAEEPAKVMLRYRAWVKSLPGKPIFVGYPVVFDWMFVCWYSTAFTGENPYSYGDSIDIKSVAMTMLKKPYFECSKKEMFPERWFNKDLPHTHVALDDARMQGALFVNMIRENLGLPKVN
jgi:hypothetical protein